MNVSFDHKIKARNDHEQRAVDLIEQGSVILANHLDVNVMVRVERMNGWGSSDAYHSGLYRCRHLTKKGMMEPMIKINLRNLYGSSIKGILEVLGHEFRHAVQDQHGICDKDISEVDMHKKAFWTVGYWNKSVEKDARKYQKAYRDIILNIIGDIGDDIIPGVLPEVENREATRKKYGLKKGEFIILTQIDKSASYLKLSDFNEYVEKKFKKFTSTAKKVLRNKWSELRTTGLMIDWVPVMRTIDETEVLY